MGIWILNRRRTQTAGKLTSTTTLSHNRTSWIEVFNYLSFNFIHLKTRCRLVYLFECLDLFRNLMFNSAKISFEKEKRNDDVKKGTKHRVRNKWVWLVLLYLEERLLFFYCFVIVYTEGLKSTAMADTNWKVGVSTVYSQLHLTRNNNRK